MAIFLDKIKMMHMQDSATTSLLNIIFNGSELLVKDNNNNDWGKALMSNKRATITQPWAFAKGITIDTINSETLVKIQTSLEVKESLSVSGNCTITGATNIENSLVVVGDIQGLSFNATSDQRAKMNIRLADFNACEMIKHWPVYTFEYKNTSHLPMLGTLAQDMIDDNINNFSFVNNKKATGEKGDYMNIKESKIVYVLLKAVQEQQEEIEKLKAEIKNLQK